MHSRHTNSKSYPSAGRAGLPLVSVVSIREGSHVTQAVAITIATVQYVCIYVPLLWCQVWNPWDPMSHINHLTTVQGQSSS